MNLFLPTHGGHSDVSLLADKKSPFRQIVPLLSAQEMIVVNFTQLQPRIRPGSALQYVTIHAAQLREGFEISKIASYYLAVDHYFRHHGSTRVVSSYWLIDV